MAYSRRATHAAPHGSGWYESVPEKLRQCIGSWLADADTPSTPTKSKTHRLFGIVSPHAGLSYGGTTAARAYAVMKHYLASERGSKVSTIFVLGPSHFKGFTGVEMSEASQYETPLGPIAVDNERIGKIMGKLKAHQVPVAFISKALDEKEHSLELQLPFIASVVPQPSSVRLVPMLVGDADPAMEKAICAALKGEFDDEKNIFVFSSDFCHWGSRFGFTHIYSGDGKREKHIKHYESISDSIKAMDREAAQLLASGSTSDWYDYFDRTENTICGRHPLGIGMHYWSSLEESIVELVGYSQSSRAETLDDCSVSYAAMTIHV